MFSNLNWYNVVVLLLLALFIFGDKLPKIISDGLRLLRNLRRMAQTATSDLSRELGTDIQIEDLHPKTFVRKHLLSEDDQEKLLRPLKGVSDDLVEQTRGVERELKDAGRQADRVAGDVRDSAGLAGATGSRKSRAAAKGTGRRSGSRSLRADPAEPATSSAPASGSTSAGESTAPATPATGDAAGGSATDSVPSPRSSFDDIT